MTATVANIWRHPLKSHGREALNAVSLTAGKTMPGDRVWAVAHEASHFNAKNPQWVPCQSFSRGSQNPALMAINARYDEGTGKLTLTHPDLPEITFNPDNRAECWRFLDWVLPLKAAGRAEPAEIVKVEGRGMTDTDYPSVSINSLASLRSFSETAGQEVSPLRWRGNIWLDGLEPWQEFDWIDQEITIGSVTLRIREPIMRCLATSANPASGARDVDTLKLLEDGWATRISVFMPKSQRAAASQSAIL